MGKWVTINGTHVYIEDGQSPMDAFIRKEANKKTKINESEIEKYEELKRKVFLEKDLLKSIKMEKELKELQNKIEKDNNGTKIEDVIKKMQQEQKEKELEGYKPVKPSKKMVEDSQRTYEEMNKEEINIINKYTETDYEQINYSLRNTEEDKLDNDTKNKMKVIDKEISKNQVDKDIVVYRGVDAKDFDYYNYKDIITDSAYVSTSFSQKIAKEFSNYNNNPYMLKILVPKGTNALLIGTNTGLLFNEQELLLPRNLKYKVIDKSNKEMIIKVIK